MERFRIGFPLALAGLLLAGGSASAANLVLNGGFEDNPLARGEVIPDRGYFCFKNAVNPLSTYDHWTQSGGEDSCYYRQSTDGFPAAYGGSYMMNINDGVGPEMVIGQGIALVGGTTYKLDFAVAGNSGATSVGALTVKLGSSFEQTIAARPVSLGWLTYSFEYTPTADSVQFLSFTATDGRLGSVVIDEVSVTAAVPEPGTWAMLVAGLSGLVVVARRRRTPSPS